MTWLKAGFLQSLFGGNDMKKYLGLLLTLVFPLTLVAGCSSSSDEADADKAGRTSSPGVSEDGKDPQGHGGSTGQPGGSGGASESPGTGNGSSSTGQQADPGATPDPTSGGFTDNPVPDPDPPPPATSAPPGPGVKPTRVPPKLGPARPTVGPPGSWPPKVDPPLESHPGDKDNFFVETDDYVVWAHPSQISMAYREYRLVSFNPDGTQALFFMKFVFLDEVEAKDFAATNESHRRVGNVVYYAGWMGTREVEKVGVLRIATAPGNEVYISKP